MLSLRSGVVGCSGIGTVLPGDGGSGPWSEVVVQVRDGLVMFFELLVQAYAGLVNAVGDGLFVPLVLSGSQ